MSQALVAVKSARAYLNDYNGITWGDHILFPLLQEAYGELIQELSLNQVGVIKYQTPPIPIPAGQLDLGTSQPTNILDPISMFERFPGQDSAHFQEMTLVGYLPEEIPNNYLTYWSWIQERITFIGALVDKEVILRYKGYLSTPTLLTDPLGVTFSERFLGPRIAALASESVGRDSSNLNSIAQANLYKLIQRSVLEDQRPIRRKAYRSPKPSFWTGTIAPLSVVSTDGGTSVKWISTSTPPDGARTTFNFPFKPKYVSWNGLNQFEGVGYTIVMTGNVWTITFIDVNGNVLTPGANDDIRAEVN